MAVTWLLCPALFEGATFLFPASQKNKKSILFSKPALQIGAEQKCWTNLTLEFRPRLQSIRVTNQARPPVVKAAIKISLTLGPVFFFLSVCLPYSFKIIKTPTPWNSKKRVKFKVGFIQLNGCQRRLLGEILSLCESPELGIGYKNGPGASSKVEMSNQMTRFYWVPFFSVKDSFHFNHFVSQLCAKSPGW